MGPKATAIEHKNKYGATYMINLFGAIIPIIVFLAYANSQIHGLATEEEVANLIGAHNIAGMHPAAALAVSNIQGQLDSILLLQIEARIEKLIRVVCQNPSLRPQLDESIKRAITDYNAISDRVYVKPACIELGVV